MAIQLTESAAKRILFLIAKEEDSASQVFRITVSGGGCSGFQYAFAFDTKVNKEDHVFDDHGVKVVIDEASLPFIDGSQIDYVEELIGSAFQIKNPNASSSCGCGSSFSV